MSISLRRTVTLLILAAAVAAALWVFYQSGNNREKGTAGRIAAGMPAPEFEATTLDGQKVRLKDYQGQTVLINFWASWCKPCVREMPLLNEVHTASDSGVETLFINVGESKGTVSEFMKAQKFSFPVSIDVTGKISTAYEVTALPATFILDKAGYIRNAQLGEITDFALLEQWLAEAEHSKF
ncbi:hypothetical protein GCM10010912_12950 [Paenibacillus albidus]|uniref:Thioredoxin domain-containing protein n=1 Tax=Paenibacillus albidus TaxID=2041023 RepID=A0A917C3R8_9BACL|nr:redoxin domain-containing protein [Paenibacillus albidus]GGF69255.1 hypothetical protein GCM10010912_12950 [Paenibacillus albidus]